MDAEVADSIPSMSGSIGDDGSEAGGGQAALFYEFSLRDDVPQDHLLRLIGRFVDLGSIRASSRGLLQPHGPSVSRS